MNAVEKRKISFPPPVQSSLYRLKYSGFNLSTYIINERLFIEFSTGIGVILIVEDI
jgi:hypothetical protein